MTKKYTMVDFRDVVHKRAAPPNCDSTLQIEAVYAEDGESKGIWLVGDQFLNGIGVAMGGFLTSAADIMMAYAIATKLDEQQSFASIDIHTTFHRPVKTGQVLVSAKVERIGKKVAYVVAELVQNDKTVASAVSSIMILEN